VTADNPNILGDGKSKSKESKHEKHASESKVASLPNTHSRNPTASSEEARHHPPLMRSLTGQPIVLDTKPLALPAEPAAPATRGATFFAATRQGDNIEMLPTSGDISKRSRATSEDPSS
jgi:hypothetical protein